MFTRFVLTAVTGAALAAAAAVVSPTAAVADPVAQCPPGFILASADFGPATAALDASGNQDGFVCRLLFRAGANLGIANIVDNRIPLHVPFRP